MGQDGLEAALGVLARDEARHVVGDPATEADLRGLERALGRALPASFRTFLTRLGSGLLYDSHEIFGPYHVMVHDIELVPSLTAVVAQLGPSVLVEGIVPFHRFASTLHAFDLRVPGSDRVLSLPDGPTYPDLATFLEAVVLPSGSP
jgi:hypothetical protein